MRTRTAHRSRLVPHTVDGQTEMILDHYTVQVPVPPRDWDQVVLAAVTAIAAIVVAASVVWSTASIGDLLARVVHPGAAYGAAIVFDLAWIACLAVEWLSRYDRRRARLPRRAGWAALALAMAAVGAHGWIAGQLVIGLVGAAVSGLAKGLWTVVLGYHAPPLDDRTQQWVEKQLARAGGNLALVPVRRRVHRAEALAAAERTALAGRHPDTAADTPDTVSGPDTRADATVRAAVRAAVATMPGADPDAIADTLTASRIATDPDTVRAVLHADTDTRTDSPDSRPDGTVRPIRTAGRHPSDTIADTIRTALASGVTDTSAVLSAVRSVHGQRVSADTVARTRRRIERTA